MPIIVIQTGPLGPLKAGIWFDVVPFDYIQRLIHVLREKFTTKRFTPKISWQNHHLSIVCKVGMMWTLLETRQARNNEDILSKL